MQQDYDVTKPEGLLHLANCDVVDCGTSKRFWSIFPQIALNPVPPPLLSLNILRSTICLFSPEILQSLLQSQTSNLILVPFSFAVNCPSGVGLTLLGEHPSDVWEWMSSIYLASKVSTRVRLASFFAAFPSSHPFL